ncbi:MAG: adenylate/guanylate cyclase domain-containing protein [Armatimonadota bacterium]
MQADESVRGEAGAGGASADRTAAALVAHMRHELRTPLNAIIGYSEMLLEDSLEEADEQFSTGLARVRDAGRNLLHLVNELLDPSHSPAVSFDFATFSGDVRHALRDPLNAALGYSDLLLDDARVLGRDEYVPELEKIVAAGKRLLSLVDEIGRLSDCGPGGTAAAPVASALANDVAGTMVQLDEAGRAAPHHGGGHVLVVDDNDVNRDLLSRRLAREGYSVTTVESGRLALQLLQEQPHDLVLLDIMMPEINGYQVLQQMKADEQLRHIPVIMISALDDMGSVVRCIELGAEDHLHKPFDPVLLRARVGACLEKKRLRDREVLYLQQIEEEKRRADELLHVILPDQIVTELKEHNTVKPRHYENVAVLFCDVVGFTPFCERRTPEEVMAVLQELIEAYEELVLRYGMEKIKTIGDSFMATAGLLQPSENPVLTCVQCGLEMIEIAQRLPSRLMVRVGVHVGSVMAGVVGHRQYLFDLWGDTVNTAARVESHGANGYVNVSGAAWQQVSDYCRGESLGLILLKGKGEMELFRIEGLHSPAPDPATA